jgi:hypothetical protein
MIILWVRKRKAEKEPDSSPKIPKSFDVHAETMKKFRDAHPSLEVKANFPGDIITTDGNLLAPVDSVRLSENTQN